MGFCLFNNAAIAVRIAQQAGAKRVAIVDIDVHHGNGTQDIFYADPTVLYTSLHQFPWYPGTGSSHERGDPGASGTTINVPVAPGTGGKRWLEMFDEVVMPAVAAHDPDLLVVSAGFDAHRDDPLAELALDDDTYCGGGNAHPHARRCALRGTKPVAARRWLRPEGNRRVSGRMPARARRLTTAGLVAACAALLAACGAATPRTSPTAAGTPTASAIPTASPTPQLIGTMRTVLSPLGLRIHSAPALGSANVVGNFGQGATFTVLDYQSGGGGWLKVQGRSKVGWIVADPTLTAPGIFNQYGSANGIAALYPQTWGFQQESYGVIFLPEEGTQNMLLETGPTLESFGPPGLPGYTQSISGTVVVCGYTGSLDEYAKNAANTGPTPTALPVPRLALYDEIRIKFDATHAMLIGFNYQNTGQLDVFADLYNSLTFPFPLCEAPASDPDAKALARQYTWVPVL